MTRQRTALVLLALLLVCTEAPAQPAEAAKDDAAKADYAARLKAGKEAAYRQYLPGYAPGIAPAKASVATTPATAAPRSAPAALPAGTLVGRSQPPIGSALLNTTRPGAGPYRVVAPYGYTIGSSSYRLPYHFNYRPHWWYDRDCSSFIFQPDWDWRYRRSWPRPVLVRRYVPSHYVYQNGQYRYQPSYVTYETKWTVYGWPRFHWNGSHYSVSIRYR